MKLKMWFFFLRIKKAFRKFYNLNIFIKLRKSFAYTFLKMFALILAVLWLQFLVLPHHGCLSMSEPLSVFWPEISAKQIEYDAKHGYMHICNFTRLGFNVLDARYTFGDQEYINELLVEVTPKSKNARITFTFYSDVSISLYQSTGAMLYYENPRVSYYYHQHFYYNNYPWIKNTGSMSYSSYEPASIQFYDCNVSYFLTKNIFEKKAQLEGDILDFSCKNIGTNTNYPFDIEIVSTLVGGFNNSDDNEYGEDTIAFFQVYDIVCDATGQLTFSDSPEKRDYFIQDQNVSFTFKADKSSASLVRTPDDTALTANGLVYNASIGGYDLFPSFRNWYYNNLYIAPLTLLSVVVSSVAIILKKRNKE